MWLVTWVIVVTVNANVSLAHTCVNRGIKMKLTYYTWCFPMRKLLNIREIAFCYYGKRRMGLVLLPLFSFTREGLLATSLVERMSHLGKSRHLLDEWECKIEIISRTLCSNKYLARIFEIQRGSIWQFKCQHNGWRIPLMTSTKPQQNLVRKSSNFFVNNHFFFGTIAANVGKIYTFVDWIFLFLFVQSCRSVQY